jgi:hypothetical protein
LLWQLIMYKPTRQSLTCRRDVLVRILSEAKHPDWYSSWVSSVSSHTFLSSNKHGPAACLPPFPFTSCSILWRMWWPDNCSFLDITYCSLVDGYQRFGGTCCLHLQSRRLFHLEDGDSRFPSTKLHGVASQKTVRLILTAVRNSNVTQPFVLLSKLAIKTTSDLESS